MGLDNKNKKTTIKPKSRSISDLDDRILEADWLEETEDQIREVEEYYIDRISKGDLTYTSD
tara:strand:+ start:5726 stop:5908 length:183 start_codon:yes stop_codon:yes gene_type:complete